MPDPVLPENVNNDDTDFLFQEKLYHGTGSDQYEVRERFERNEQRIDDAETLVLETKETVDEALENLQSDHESIESLTEKVEELDEKAGTTAEGLANHLSVPNKHLPSGGTSTEVLTGNGWQPVNDMLPQKLLNHPDNTAVHVPARAPGATDLNVLSMDDENLPAWKSFVELMPEELQTILENGGNVTPEQVIDAFREITVSNWTLSGQPFGAARIKTALFAQDRFLVGASTGEVTHTFDAKIWQPVKSLFGGSSPAAVESLAMGITTDGQTPCIALDAYSDFCVSLDRASWSPRLSVRVDVNPDGTYKDRYSTADFTKALADRNLFLLFTTSGEVYRASYQEVIDEYHRVATDPNYDRHSTVWKLQESNFSITQGVLDAAAGANRFVTVGVLGRMSISGDGNIFEQISSPFGSSNINGIASGDDRFVAVADDGKIGYALFTSPKSWHLIDAKPFGTESLRAIAYGSGLFVAVSASGIVKVSKNTGLNWIDVPANMTAGGTCIAFGDTFFVIGDVNGSVVRSLSVASIFSVVTRAEFGAFMEQLLGWSAEETARLRDFVEEQLARIDEALSKQTYVANEPGKTSILGGSAGTVEVPKLDDEGNPILDENGLPVLTAQTKVPAIDHRHDNRDTVLLSQVGRPSYEGPNYPDNDPFHWPGLPHLDKFGKIVAGFNTWMRGEENGLAPLDENKLIPPDYLAAGWMYDSLIYALRDQMLLSWTIQQATLFQDLGAWSRINALACSKTTIVAVGERGKIAWGPRLDQMQMVVDSPFGPEASLVGVAHGTRPDGSEIFVAISQVQYSFSENGSEWSEAQNLSNELQGVFFGGGFFLIPDADGNIWRSNWDEENRLTFLQQDSSLVVTRGVLSVAYLENKWVGVGANNKIVGTDDPAYWNEEQSPLPADTQLNSVCAGNGFFVAVGNYGRMTKGTVSGQWTKIEQDKTTEDLHFVLYDAQTYLAAGKNGAMISSGEADAWILRHPKTNSTIRCIDYQNERFFIGTDSGQFIASASVSDVLWVDTGGGVGPSNELPNPIEGDGDPGIKNTFMRSDATIPDTGVVMEKRVGKPTRLKPDGSVDRYGVPPLDDMAVIPESFMPWQRGLPNGVAPLDESAIVPKLHLPPMEIDIEQIVQYLLNGYKLEFLEQVSPFKGGPGVSTILHDAAFGRVDDEPIYILVGEPGIGWSNNVSQWQMSETQPFGEIPVVGVSFGEDDLLRPIFVSVDTTKRFSVSRSGKNDWADAVTLEGDYDFEAINYYNRTFLILCSNGVILRSVFENGNLVRWDEQADSPNITERMNDIFGGNNLWLAVGNGGRIRLSEDASHFVPVESPTTEDLLCGCSGKGKLVVAGRNNTLLIGMTGEDFVLSSVRPFKENTDITGLGYSPDDGLFIATNSIGGISVSSDLEIWTEHPSPSVDRIKAITSGGDRIILGDAAGNILASRVGIEINFPGGGGGDCDCEPTVFIGRMLDVNENRICRVRLYDSNVLPQGEIISEVRLLPELSGSELDTIAGQDIFYNSVKTVEIV